MRSVEGDGDCLFSAVSLSVMDILNHFQNDEHMINHLLSLSISKQMHFPDMVHTLRNAVVDEWQGEFVDDYSHFVQHVDIYEEAETFRRSGTFTGDLADAMVLALSSVLRIPIVILSSIEHLPVITVTPRSAIPSQATVA